MGLIELSLRQAFDSIQIGIRQICAIELCQPQIRGRTGKSKSQFGLS
jgi:hypothetical protein